MYGLSDFDNSEFAIEANDLGYVGVGRSSVGIVSGATDAWILNSTLPVHCNGQKPLATPVLTMVLCKRSELLITATLS